VQVRLRSWDPLPQVTLQSPQSVQSDQPPSTVAADKTVRKRLHVYRTKLLSAHHLQKTFGNISWTVNGKAILVFPTGTFQQ